MNVPVILQRGVPGSAVLQQIHILRQQGRHLEEFLAFVREWVLSAPEVNSRPALLSSCVEVATLVVDPGSGLFFLGLLVYTVDASAELFCLKIWTLFLRTPCFAVFAAVHSLC